MFTKKPTGNDQTGLPFGALQLLAPPVRLVSAAIWKVMKERDVMQYGIVEEFVTTACDTVPGLLTLRHQARLALGLRARLVLELCRTKDPDPKIITVHMKRIRVPVLPSSSSSVNMESDYKIKSAVETTHALVPKLLSDAAEREHFFKEVFPSVYGTFYDQELEKLLWEFLIRLDQLLPVPSLTQTVSWLTDAPPVLEECARAASQPQLLRLLLKHQNCLGHLDPAGSLPPNMGDSIITSLSLPPSGKVPSNGPTSAHKTPFIKPVIGLISNDSVHLMMSVSHRLQSSETTNTNDNSERILSKSNISYTGVKEKQNKQNCDQAEGTGASGLKRKHIDSDRASDEEGVLRKTKCVKKRTNRNLSWTNVNCAAKDTPVNNREVLQTCLRNMGYKLLLVPNDESLCSVWVSCLKHQPKVIVEKLSLTSAYNVDVNLPKPRADSLDKTVARYSEITQSQRTKACFSGSDDKESSITVIHRNAPNIPHLCRSALQLKSNAEHPESPEEMEDYVADSEDEATKNFKGRLFTKRYCKTKHGTYVPTLREYWKPCAQRRILLAPSSKHR